MEQTGNIKCSSFVHSCFPTSNLYFHPIGLKHGWAGIPLVRALLFPFGVRCRVWEQASPYSLRTLVYEENSKTPCLVSSAPLLYREFFPNETSSPIARLPLATIHCAADPSYPEGNFGQNQLLGGSMSLSPLVSHMTSDLHVSTEFQLPSQFPMTSLFGRVDHLLSGPFV